ncbi:protein NBR1 homolog [Lactuca sativa]|uniref:ZZ-type domain-containing protein n=1 Tax=Lactuca sativa TaxID=4236 RepID=A0A9R1VYV2_LACSA|nr:protein NBR1 homolog [Lactuca sativa]KAJ0213210.1 hypothetical protein LSAT_V11C400187830 [Lactuca sativa]
MASSSIVIKVKFGKTLRRFSASINDNNLALDTVALREKIRSLFNFNPDVDFTLTYVDEDGDAVTLADDDDLRDVVGQSLNPLRITVMLENGSNGGSSGTQTPTPTTTTFPLRTSQPQIPFGPIPNVLSEFLKSMPEPLRDQITKLPLELASKATPSTPMISELVEKMTHAYLNQISGSMATPSAHTPSGEASTVKNSKPEAESSNSKNKEKVEKMSEGVKFKDVVQPPKPMDLNAPYFDYEAFPSVVEGYNGNSSTEKNKDTTDGVENKKDFGWAQGMLNATNQCPFSGMPLPNESYHHHPSRGHGHHHHWKRYGHGNGLGSLVFHRGVRCDGCGVHPITGPRFKSKVKEDYDLCSDCFAGMGNVSDYIRMDRPTNPVRHHMPFRGYHDPSVRIPTPGLPHALRAPGSKLPRAKLDSRFILDVNVLDGTTMAPFTNFTKIWRMRNNGTVIWPCGSQLQWIGGDRLSNSVSVDIEIPSDGLGVEQELDIAVDFNAPELPGRYISYWRMASPSGQKFGQRVWVLIQVDSSMKDMGETQINLNLPPVKMNNPHVGPIPEPEVINENTILTGNNLIKVNDSTEDTPPANNQDMDFPINDTLIITSNGMATTVAPPVGSPVFRSAEVENALAIVSKEPPAYPTVDFSEVPPVITGATSSPVAVVDPSGSAQEGSEDHLLQEENLLVELEAMGFKQLDLNKEVLRMNNYDLEKSVDDLCGVSEWDPMLEELQEMGFVDEEANRRLLKKNNGSIKRVVMDLINGERA